MYSLVRATSDKTKNNEKEEQREKTRTRLFGKHPNQQRTNQETCDL